MKPADFHKQHHQTITSHPTLNAAHAANSGSTPAAPQQWRRDGLLCPAGRAPCWIKGFHPRLTQFRDAPDAGGQQGLLQGPQLQLCIGVGPAIAAHRAVVVGAEVGREGQHTWERAHSTPLTNQPTLGVEKQIPPGGIAELTSFSGNF